MTQAFNKRVKRQVYRIGDLVIKRIILPQGDPRGKWIPTYEGPSVVKKAFSGGAMILATMDGEDFPHPGIPTHFYDTDLKGTKAQLTNGPIQKMAQTGLFATRSLHARLANVRYTFATRSPSEADRQQKISGFILSPLGHRRSIINTPTPERKQKKTDGNPSIETLESSPEKSE
ncbi:hypothetical protein KIW84_075887 [Lathyrus oleraceus]|uniref:Uncharacterized protein n=1 Tax=Pisum sativum TaxID=3888 RepID=A0A9D4ZYN0_PEA|nr:hypothetical protein KIW84_075887 [Pisum sativum]